MWYLGDWKVCGDQMKKLLFILTTIAVLNGQFDNASTSAANFLKVEVGGQAAAMGGAFTAQVNDVSALFWNPAGITGIGKSEVMVSQTEWIGDINHNYLAAAVKFGSQGYLGLSINQMAYGNMTRTTEFSPAGEGTFTANDLSLGLAYGTRISDKFSTGIQFKIIRETISFSSANAVAVDVGSQYTTSFSGLKIGMAITNFGSKMTLSGTDQKVDIDAYEDLNGNPDVIAQLGTEQWSLPMTFKVGLSFSPVGPDALIKQEKLSLTVNAEYSDPRDFNPIYMAGAELTIMKLLYLRAGVKNTFLRYPDDLDDVSDKALSDYEEGKYINRFSMGFGLSSKNFPFIPYRLNLDYAYSDLGLLGWVPRLTLRINF